MKRAIDRARAKFDRKRFDRKKFDKKSHEPPQLDGAVDKPSTIGPPTAAEVNRYKYAHGANLGSIFVQERWLTGAFYSPGCSGTAELAAVTDWFKKEGLEATRNRFQKHWKEYVSDADLDWLRDIARCNSVRLPIGYFTLGPAYCHDTPFEEVSFVYQNAWDYVKLLIKRCNQRGISTLLDFHALPGGANPGDHSGTNSGTAAFWNSKNNKALATRCLCFIAHQAENLEGLAGIQIVNESETNAKGMYEWYDSVLTEFGKIDPSIPVYVSDAWNLGKAVEWSLKKNSAREKRSPVVIDTHLYWCFTDEDSKKSPQQVTAEVWSKLSELDGKAGKVHSDGAVQVIVGEYSCVLAEQSWELGGQSGKTALVQQFGVAQSKRYQQRAGGSYMWTYRMDWMPGGEWGFKQMTEQLAVIPPPTLTRTIQEVQTQIGIAQAQMNAKKATAYGQHCHYWDSQFPGQYEHWRFELGWGVGFSDAMTFFGMRSSQNLQGGDTIGMLELWVMKRIRESGQMGNWVWEYEAGLRQGIAAFGECATQQQ